jgi:hypothetical protein
MKKIINYKFLIFAIGALFSFTSCLKSGLDELPAFEDTEIANIFFEHRYLDPNDQWTDGSSIVQFQRLDVSKEIKTNEAASEDSVIVTLSIPMPSGSFTTEERQKVSLESIVCYMNISTAAKIEPLDGAPVLGKPGDFTSPRKYKITAADGKTTRTWVIKVNPLPEINQYEGLYHSTGHFDHPSSPRDLDLDKYYSSVDETTITGDHSDLGENGYKITIKVNSDNTCVVTQYANGAVLGEMVPGAINKYDPATKTFTLNYRYMGGNGYRTISETLKLK